MGRLIVILIIFHCYGNSYSQSQYEIDSSTIISRIDSLNQVFSQNKLFTSELKTEILFSLSYFPELRSTKIIFKEQKIKTTLNTRPTLGSLLFRSKNNRIYVIRINNNVESSDITIDELSTQEKIGILGHEFCHIIDYQSRNFFQIMGRLFSYSTKKSKERFVKEIDMMCINRGLGWYLYCWSNFAVNESDASEKYKEFKREIYLEPEEIISIIEKNK